MFRKALSELQKEKDYGVTINNDLKACELSITTVKKKKQTLPPEHQTPYINPT